MKKDVQRPQTDDRQAQQKQQPGQNPSQREGSFDKDKKDDLYQR